MEINGRIIQVLSQRTGTGSNGEWKVQEYLLETAEQYPKKLAFSVWGDRIDQFGLKVGEDVILSISVESREYMGKWYTSVRAFGAQRSNEVQPMQAANPIPNAAPFPTEVPPMAPTNPVDDLPF